MLIQKIRRKAFKVLHPVVGEMWCLHRIVEERSPMPSNRELEVTPAFLEKKIAEATARGRRFVDLDTLIEATHHRRSRQLVNITFDDGFVDIYTHAYPLFRERQIPFTLYLTTGMPDGKADLWWLQLETWTKGDCRLFEETLKQCYTQPGNMRETMHTLTKTTVDESLCRTHSLTWEQIEEMVASGLCTVGSHTTTHPGLTRIEKETVADELTHSAQTIEQHLGQRPRHFSYPHSFSDETVVRQVREAGYGSAALGYGGELRHGADLYLLPRLYLIQA